MLEDMATASRGAAAEAREKMAAVEREVERGVRAKAESERAVKSLQGALAKTLKSFE